MVTLRGYQLDITPQLPSEFQNKSIGGLMGNYNGISSDDLLSSAGHTVPADSTEERIYYDFGETCELHIISCDLKLLYLRKRSTTRRAFGGAHAFPTMLFPRLAVNKTHASLQRREPNTYTWVSVDTQHFIQINPCTRF